MDHISEPENKLIRYGPEVVETIRHLHNFGKKDDRDEALRILDEWVKSQDHLIKRDFNKGYLERCIITSKGSIEKAKIQIDKLCTLRTLVPKYFQTINVFESDIKELLDFGYFALIPTLTKELHRVVLIKCKPNVSLKQNDFFLLFKLAIVVAEFLKSNEYCLGFTVINDIIDAADAFSKINLVELQQFLKIITEGYGTKIKGIIFLTESKFIDGFVRLLKPFFSEKIASRIHVATSRKGLQDLLPIDNLPEDYGGKQPSTQVLHDHLVKTITSEEHQKLMAEMNKACTDESRRQQSNFNDKYMGMPGTFRTLSLD